MRGGGRLFTNGGRGVVYKSLGKVFQNHVSSQSFGSFFQNQSIKQELGLNRAFLKKIFF
ncbi:unnamed protein product [Meloidogyne enterolobii]|uniref:Uncharacterized protein n=1 Tax=Meloidogyne enterolobii TaxID=390850 RepID=A0ACB1ATP9_MELEN